MLPLVPPYLCYLGGMTVEQLAEAQSARTASSRRVLWAALAFVLGFSTVFISLGATATFIGQFVAEYMDVLAKIAGATLPAQRTGKAILDEAYFCSTTLAITPT